MLKRIITSIVALIILAPILIFHNTWLLPVAMSILAVVGVLEMTACIGFKFKWYLSIPICAVAAVLPIYMRYTFENGRALLSALKLCVSLAIVLSLYVFGVAVFANKSVPIADAGLLLASSLYILSAFTAIVYIHDYIINGSYIYLLTFICSWTTDIFAYFTGRFLGKHKLIPAVSPKKTVEGAIGGIVFCVASTVLFGFIIVKFFNPQAIIKANYLILAISGVLISIVSQVGDLIMSVIKRHYGIKDYGKVFPGHGGVLDRFDSVLAVSLILTVICTYFDLLSIVIA